MGIPNYSVAKKSTWHLLRRCCVGDRPPCSPRSTDPTDVKNSGVLDVVWHARRENWSTRMPHHQISRSHCTRSPGPTQRPESKITHCGLCGDITKSILHAMGRPAIGWPAQLPLHSDARGVPVAARTGMRAGYTHTPGRTAQGLGGARGGRGSVSRGRISARGQGGEAEGFAGPREFRARKLF